MCSAVKVFFRSCRFNVRIIQFFFFPKKEHVNTCLSFARRFWNQMRTQRELMPMFSARASRVWEFGIMFLANRSSNAASCSGVVRWRFLVAVSSRSRSDAEPPCIDLDIINYRNEFVYHPMSHHRQSASPGWVRRPPDASTFLQTTSAGSQVTCGGGPSCPQYLAKWT